MENDDKTLHTVKKVYPCDVEFVESHHFVYPELSDWEIGQKTYDRAYNKDSTIKRNANNTPQFCWYVIVERLIDYDTGELTVWLEEKI